MGMIGQGITKNLVEKGDFERPLVLYNRTQSRAEEQSAKIGSSVVAKSLSEVIATSDIIWSCIQDEDAVMEIFEKLLGLDLHGKLFLESSTVPYKATDVLAQRVIKAGAEFVSMPVFGEPSVAYSGNLICVPAGAPASVARVKPFLEGIVGKAIIDLSGESPGKAALLKMIGNVMIVSTMETIAEVNVLAEKAGVGSHYVQELIGGYYKVAPPLYSRAMCTGAYYQKEPMVEVAKALKLGSKVLELANSMAVPLKGYQVGIEHMAVAQAQGGTDCDITSIYGAVRLESGLSFQNQD